MACPAVRLHLHPCAAPRHGERGSPSIFANCISLSVWPYLPRAVSIFASSYAWQIVSCCAVNRSRESLHRRDAREWTAIWRCCPIMRKAAIEVPAAPFHAALLLGTRVRRPRAHPHADIQIDGQSAAQKLLRIVRMRCPSPHRLRRRVSAGFMNSELRRQIGQASSWEATSHIWVPATRSISCRRLYFD